MDVSVPSHLVYVAQLSVGTVFLLSSLPKLRRPGSFAQSVAAYEVVPAAVAHAVGLALVPVEAFLALALLSGWLADVALPLAAVLLLGFLLAVGINLRRGRQILCGCFGSASEPISPRTAIRLFVLLTVVLSALAVRRETGDSSPRLGTTSADGLALAYAVEAASLSAFLILLGVWLFGRPGLVEIARSARWGQPSSVGASGGDGAEGA